MPTARELQAIGAHGATCGAAHRTTLMNQIGHSIGIPPGGWVHGQSRLFDGKDVRLVWLLRRMARADAADRVSKNLSRARTIPQADLMLTLVTAAREHSSSVVDVSTQPIDSWREGGLDFLWREKDRLGLPRSVTGNWVPVRPFISPETKREVHPALIQGRDQVLIYAAQTNANFTGYFMSHLNALTSGAAASTISRASREALLVWKAYAFLAPGGALFDSARSVAAQSGQPFGIRTALSFLTGRSTAADNRVDLDDILTLSDLNQVEWIRSAKVRAAEALFLERFWTVARDLLPPSW